MVPATALSRLASLKMMIGPLPPISSMVCLPAARPATRCPVSVEPTKPTPATRGWPAISSPTTEPAPVTRLKAPGGRSASARHSASFTELGEALEAREQTTVLPAASAPAQSPRPSDRASRGLAPGRPVGGLHGALRILAGALWDGRDRPPAAGAGGGEGLAALGRHPLAADEHLQGLGLGCRPAFDHLHALAVSSSRTPRPPSPPAGGRDGSVSLSPVISASNS